VSRIKTVLQALVGSVRGVAIAFGTYGLLLLYMSALMGFVLGANAGAVAGSPEEAHISGTAVDEVTVSEIRSDRTERPTHALATSVGEAVGVDYEPHPIDPRVQRLVVGVVNGLLDVALWVAGATAPVVYQLNWIPVLVWQVIGWAGMSVPLGVLVWRRLSLWRSVT